MRTKIQIGDVRARSSHSTHVQNVRKVMPLINRALPVKFQFTLVKLE